MVKESIMAIGFKKLDIPGLVYIELDMIGDNRGFFVELYKESLFKANGIDMPLVQANLSKSSKGVLRGLHYQIPPKAQGKIVGVMSGEIFDVAVDVRKGSPTYGQWFGVKLTAKQKNMLYIPEGFAHGFYTLEDAEVMYFCSNEYSKEHERGFIWNDSAVGVNWQAINPTISERDQKLPLFKDSGVHFNI